MLVDSYITYIGKIKRYSLRTVEIYSQVLRGYFEYTVGEKPDQLGHDGRWIGHEQVKRGMNSVQIRNYQVHLLDEKEMSARTVCQHMSILSGFSKYLMTQKVLESNPVAGLSRPKQKKRLPEFYKEESMADYLSRTEVYGSEDLSVPYENRLGRLVVLLLFSCGIRRSELIGLNISSLDRGRKCLRVHGKGDKIREIPLVDVLFKEILLYLDVVEAVICGERQKGDSLLVRESGEPLYPVLVDRIVKRELQGVKGVTGKRSPHVLRHTLATELLNAGTDLNSIKELLGHSSLAATQVYTHNSIAKLKKVYQTAHPRAKNGGKNGD